MPHGPALAMLMLLKPLPLLVVTVGAASACAFAVGGLLGWSLAGVIAGGSLHLRR